MAKPRLIIVYGPPAAGKLTVANALAKRIGYKVFHNHLTTDAVRSVLSRETRSSARITNAFRKQILLAAASEGVPGTIFTYVYAHKTDDAWLTSIIEGFEKAGGRVSLVQLVCDPKELERRIREPSRKPFHKIKEQRILRDLLERHDLYTSYPKRPSLVIDNTKVPAGKVAATIAKHYKL